MKDKILVHICCAPDALYFLKRLREDYPRAEIIAFFYDPNIHPYEEYKLRLLETERTCQKLGITLVEGEYDQENWLKAVKGLEKEPEKGKRCEVCFDYRLSRALQEAKKRGCNLLTTTLLMSPKKSAEQLKRVGEKLTAGNGIKFLAPDYRKGGGTQEMFRLSREMEFYMQDYCGCVYGLINQKGERAWKDLVSWKGRLPGSKEEKLFLKELRLLAEEKGLPTREREFVFLNWRVLEGSLEAEGTVVPSQVYPFSSSLRGVVKTRLLKRNGSVFFFEKQGLRVILGKPGKRTGLPGVPAFVPPTFVVPQEYSDLLETGKVKATLRTEVFPDRSGILVVGSEEAPKFVGVAVDAVNDEEILSLTEAVELLDRFGENIKRKELALLFLGAESLGRAASSFVREFYGKEVEILS